MTAHFNHTIIASLDPAVMAEGSTCPTPRATTSS